MARSRLAILISVVVLLSGCSSLAPVTTPEQTPAATAAQATSSSPVASPGPSTGGGRYGGGGTGTASPAPGAVVVTTAATSLGAALTGPNGLTLYTHVGDTATSSSCTGGCASAWPPLTVAAGTQATAGSGVTGTLGTLTRVDGSRQVTYMGLPLYGWQGDSKAGDVTGQGISGFSVAKP